LRDVSRLLQDCIAGDRDSQKELYDRFASRMLSVCLRYAGSREDALDIFQEGFLKVFENLKQLKDPKVLEWWMRKIFINEALQLYHKSRKIELFDETTNKAYERQEEEHIFSTMGKDEITNLIQKLPEKMRLVFNLYVIEGYSHQEISDMMQISQGTSKSNLHDARKKLQKGLIDLEKTSQFG